MTEKSFLRYLNGLLRRGRVNQISCVIDSEEPVLRQLGEFIGGHALLPENYEKIPKVKIIEIGEFLINGTASISTKEAIIMILAHHPSLEALSVLQKYNKKPDEGLEFFAMMALDECQWWNE